MGVGRESAIWGRINAEEHATFTTRPLGSQLHLREDLQMGSTFI